MQPFFTKLSPEDRKRVELISSLWNDVANTDDPGRTTREVLRKLQQDVTDCLYLDPPNVAKAESLTALAMGLITGMSDWDDR